MYHNKRSKLMAIFFVILLSFSILSAAVLAAHGRKRLNSVSRHEQSLTKSRGFVYEYPDIGYLLK